MVRITFEDLITVFEWIFIDPLFDFKYINLLCTQQEINIYLPIHVMTDTLDLTAHND